MRKILKIYVLCMESRLIIKNVNYNKYHDIFSFISRQGFKKYRKKEIYIKPIDYQYYSVNTFNKKKIVNIEIDDTNNHLYEFLNTFSKKYAYNKASNKPYINNINIYKYKFDPDRKTIREIYTWV